MSTQLQALRPLGTVSDIPSVSKVISDADSNFKLLFRQTPQVVDDLPAPGTIRFLAQEEDGSWHTYALVAGTDITFTLDTTLKTLTIETP